MSSNFHLHVIKHVHHLLMQNSANSLILTTLWLYCCNLLQDSAVSINTLQHVLKIIAVVTKLVTQLPSQLLQQQSLHRIPIRQNTSHFQKFQQQSLLRMLCSPLKHANVFSYPALTKRSSLQLYLSSFGTTYENTSIHFTFNSQPRNLTQPNSVPTMVMV